MLLQNRRNSPDCLRYERGARDVIDPTNAAYRQTVGRAAHALVGIGFYEQAIPDFTAKFDLFRDMVGMTKTAWPDNIFARLLFGDQQGSAVNWSRKKNGQTSFSSEDAAATAQIMNFFAGFSVDDLTGYQSSRFDAPCIAFMMTQKPGNASLRAVDLALPSLEFAGRLASLLKFTDQEISNDILHDRAMKYLHGLRNVCDREKAVAFLRGRQRGEGLTRFGGAQVQPEQPPWEREPITFRAGDKPIVGLDFVSKEPCEIWGVTIRDPRPSSMTPRAGPLCWDEPWENLVRWSPPRGPIEPGEPLVIDYGSIVDMRGEYSVYLLVDASAKGDLRKSLGKGDRLSVPVEALHALLANAGSSKAKPEFDCYMARYKVRGALLEQRDANA
jgi:hypothetical protein